MKKLFSLLLVACTVGLFLTADAADAAGTKHHKKKVVHHHHASHHKHPHKAAI